jgi:molecular chaperone GrpE
MSKDKQVRKGKAREADAAPADADTAPDLSEAVHGAVDAESAEPTEPAEQVDADSEATDPVETLTPEERLQARVTEVESELAEVSESLLRKSADFENYRKRMMREKEDFVAYANRELLLDIVSIIDDFERAIRSADESNDFTAFHDGIVMIEKQFTSMLERKWKLARFDSVGEEFDPQRHEAMMTEERPDHQQSMVTEDFQKGYMLHEKVLRPAKVKVSLPMSDAVEDQAAKEES